MPAAMGSEESSEHSIECRVISALPDVITVSCVLRNVQFQGALIAVSGQKPLGINPEGGFEHRLEVDNPRNYRLDTFPSLSCRQTYFQHAADPVPDLKSIQKNANRSMLSGNKVRQGPLRIRLRARQVLCTRCKGVCNESGERVQKTTTGEEVDDKSTKRPVKNPSFSELKLYKVKKYHLVPKIKRLCPSEIRRLSSSPQQPPLKIKLTTSSGHETVNGSYISKNSVLHNPSRPSSNPCPGDTCEEEEEEEEESPGNSVEMKENSLPSTSARDGQAQPSTPVLKISFGPQKTVLKIPSKETAASNKYGSDAVKAARKSLKKARKAARRKACFEQHLSPRRIGWHSPLFVHGSPRPMTYSESDRRLGSPSGQAPGTLQDVEWIPTPSYSANLLRSEDGFTRVVDAGTRKDCCNKQELFGHDGDGHSSQAKEQEPFELCSHLVSEAEPNLLSSSPPGEIFGPLPPTSSV